ncbi:hypothetical protein LTR97_004330 [Elasticomyces elasticus]|uniref:IBR domain-containing protein n=1 Tax=Elasticomyces elasticus TaxID=574655 RepID=A0AAN7WL55_9PEZI|nr:hypothetical protein LTR97_004330 [Elasticomyces elasticus]
MSLADSSRTCTVCLSGNSDEAKHFLVDGDLVCTDCIIDSLGIIFLDAIKHERLWPVRWGAATVSPLDFPGVFPKSLEVQWRARGEEYKVKRPDRVYCKHLVLAADGESRLTIAGGEVQDQCPEDLTTCGRFLGAMQLHQGGMHCEHCSGYACKACGESMSLTIVHECGAEAAAAAAAAELAEMKTALLAGKCRGRDYQECPTCTEPVFLIDGCNAMLCVCFTHFCFICGVEAHHDSTHWRQGGCPRWNQPGAENAYYDVPINGAIEEFRRTLEEMSADILVVEEQIRLLRERRIQLNTTESNAAFRMRRELQVEVLDILPKALQDFRSLLQAANEDPSLENESLVWEEVAVLNDIQHLVLDLDDNIGLQIILDPVQGLTNPAMRVSFYERHARIDDLLNRINSSVWERYPELTLIHIMYLSCLTWID